MTVIQNTTWKSFSAASKPLTVLERSVYRGPNLYSARAMIRIQIDLGQLENWPTHLLPCFTDELTALLPSLATHGCSYQEEMGFLRRLREGTWLGHVIEHVALELQSLAGSPVTRGKTRSVKGRVGVYNILYAYHDEDAGLAAGAHAIRLVAALLPENLKAVKGLSLLDCESAGDPKDVGAIVADLRQLLRRNALGPTTAALVEAAAKRGIPVTRLNNQSLIQFGYGSRQKRIRASITGDTSQIAVDIAGDKFLTKQLLDEAGLPVPRGVVVRSEAALLEEARRLRKPVVVKPLDGNHGRGVTTGLIEASDIAAAYHTAREHSRHVIVEEQVPGNDHRILLVGGKVVAVAERLPAQVAGDGRSSILRLIEEVNKDPRRGEGHENLLTRIVPDARMETLLAKRGLTLDSVPAKAEVVRLRDTANLSTGGTAVDRTGEIHPFNLAMAEQAAAVVGLDVCGIDFLSPDITRPVSETGGGIVELNAAPGFRMHLEPSVGQPRDVAGPVIDALFPHSRRSRIPIFAVTGTNGKSTTVRMIARILQHHGLNVGMTTTTGIYFNDHLLKKSDASGPKSARVVLRNPKVDVAVLETARGGMLREGLAFDRADLGAVLNVSADHLGMKGVNTLDDLADVKGIVTENVARRGHAILNADDPMCVRLARHAGGELVWFSLEGGHLPEMIKRHILSGGMSAVREPGPDGGSLVWFANGERSAVLTAAEIPATLGGMAEFNIANALAAIAMCAAHGLPLKTIADGLRRFTNSYEDSPGRLNMHEVGGMRILVDYAHNPGGLEALGKVLAQMRQKHDRVIGMINIPGDRRDEDIMEVGRIAARMFDEIVFREAPDARGRPRGEVNALMAKGALLTGMAPERIQQIVDEIEAADTILRMGRPGDLLVLLPTSVQQVWEKVVAFHPSSPTESESRSHSVDENRILVWAHAHA
jgi:cyanophycin synthetase